MNRPILTSGLAHVMSDPAAIPPRAAAALASLRLIRELQVSGLGRVVLCPGSRSGPLAVAASLLEGAELKLSTAIDERSAAFFALGLARGEGRVAAVITTSGTAVANLLPALVEADLGTIPLLVLTADRPQRLKGCGANQTVNQEAFLLASCRWFGQGDPQGLAAMDPGALQQLARQAMAAAAGGASAAPGPVHLNLPLEEPLHPDGPALDWLKRWWSDQPEGKAPAPAPAPGPTSPPPAWGEVGLDPDRPGVVVAGPWRGGPVAWSGHRQALAAWQRRSGWPLLADALSGLRGRIDGPLIAGYDLLLQSPPPELDAPQVLRLGPLPASRRLQDWLERQAGPQVLVSEGDPRPLDPLRRVVGQWNGGLASWPALASAGAGMATREARDHCDGWLRQESRIQELLHGACLDHGGGEEPINEPWLARRLSRLLPAGLALMLANSSPVRDWESFADPGGPGRATYAFRGASGIDGTLSIACGLAEALGKLVLVSGDLALQHDSNGWLWSSQLQGRLLVVLIDNGGGGIFEQLPIRPPGPQLSAALPFERLFAMPQSVDPCALAAAHGVPSREVRLRGELEPALTWGLARPLALLRVRTDRRADADRRRRLRTMAAELSRAPADDTAPPA